MSSKEERAKEAIQDAKIMVGDREYEKAKSKIQKAIDLLPTVRYGQEMITVCEILHLSQTPKYSRTKTWPFTLLQIPTSIKESEVNSRYQKLMSDLRTIKQFKGTSAAIEELDYAMAMYKVYYPNLDNDKKRKASSPSAVSVGSDVGGHKDDDDDDDPYAARSTTDFKKLRELIFEALPQEPHFRPMAKYCASVRHEMRLVFDVIFVKLAQKLQTLGDLSHKEEDTDRGELSNLEEMGYDVKKLRERFDLLVRVKTLAKEGETYAEKRRKLEGEIKAEMDKVECRIAGLKNENEVVKAQQISFRSEMASLRATLSKGDLYNIVKMEIED